MLVDEHSTLFVFWISEFSDNFIPGNLQDNLSSFKSCCFHPDLVEAMCSSI
jgi:hypothetical protein